MNFLLSLFYPQVNNKKIYYPELDLFRLTAVVMVIFFHSILLSSDFYVYNYWPKLVNPLFSFLYEGHAGVDLLFVLTGFLLFASFVDKKLSVKALAAYFLRRAKRILPLYFASIILALFVVVPPDLTIPAFIPYLLFLTNLPIHFTYLSPFNAVYWAIAVEVHFSLVFPLFARILTRPKPLLAVFALSLVFKLVMFNNLTYLSSVYGRLDQFLIGIVLANICLRSDVPQRLLQHKNRLLLLIIAAVILLWLFLLNLNLIGGYFVKGFYQPVYHTLEAVIWGLLILLVFSANLKMHMPFESIKKLLEKNTWLKSVTALSTISYSMFIWHFPIASYVIKWQKANGFSASEPNMIINTLFVILPIVIAVSGASYLIIEKPFLKYKVKC